MAKYIEFKHTRNSKSGKTKIWEVLTIYNDGSLLGIIAWFPRWRKYSFFPAPDTVFEQICLRDIADFCETETKKQKAPAASERNVLA